MYKAYEESLKGLGKTRPNPIVGALVVKNNKIISRGAHFKAGGKHAEVIALEKAGNKAKGAELYVTLEPCSTHGKTPPCTDKIISSGIKKIYIGCLDPNPRNYKQGVKILKRRGIKVSFPLLEGLIKDSNRVFNKYITRKMPFVTVKIAQSMDGKIATRLADSKWITSIESRRLAHKMRAYFDAVITSVNTVIKDNPLFKEAKTKIILDSRLRIPLRSRILSKNTIIVTTKNVNRKKINTLSKKAQVLFIPKKNKRINLTALLKELARREISSVMVEAGSDLVGSFFDERLVDKACIFVALKIVGGRGAYSSVGGKGISKIKQALALKECTLIKLKHDILIEGYL